MSWQDSCGPYIATPELKRRGWTRSMIERLLGEPDSTAPNPGGRNAPRVRLWLITKVEQLESTEEFRERLAKAAAHRSR